MFFWNRKKIFCGHSLEKLSIIREILSVNKIKYEYKVVNHNSGSLFTSRRAVTGTMGEEPKYMNIYYLYVNKNDYDKSVALINKI